MTVVSDKSFLRSARDYKNKVEFKHNIIDVEIQPYRNRSFPILVSTTHTRNHIIIFHHFFVKCISNTYLQRKIYVRYRYHKYAYVRLFDNNGFELAKASVIFDSLLSQTDTYRYF